MAPPPSSPTEPDDDHQDDDHPRGRRKPRPADPLPGLLVFSDDWGRHPSSCQHLVGQLLDDFSVTWVNTIGTRRVRLDRLTLQRGSEKISAWLKPRPPEDAHPPRVLNPTMLPAFAGYASRRVNCALLDRHLRRHVPNLGSHVILTTVPVVADLVGRIPAHSWFYYCVDDFSVWPGLDGPTLERMEAALVAGADHIIVAGENLADRIHRLGRPSRVLEHGVDLEFWLPKNEGARKVPPRLAGLEHPLVLFWGLIDRRIDTGWLRALGNRMSSGTIGLIGPEQAPDPDLARLPRLRRLGSAPFDELPTLASHASALIMPYRRMPVTLAMQPLKLKEYLATQKPVITRRLPGTRAWEDCFTATDSEDAFADAVLHALAHGLPPAQRQARERLRAESWSAKANTLRRWLHEGLE